MIWVGVDLSGTITPERSAPRFPALLDTGNNFGFSIQRRQLQEWAGFVPDPRERLDNLFVNNQPVPCYSATVWLYANLRGLRDIDAVREAIPVDTK